MLLRMAEVGMFFEGVRRNACWADRLWPGIYRRALTKSGRRPEAFKAPVSDSFFRGVVDCRRRHSL